LKDEEIDMFLQRWALAMLLSIIAFSGRSDADQPRLGFSGTLVRVPGQDPLRGYRVDSVTRDSLAAKMGLRRGDLVMIIGETFGFTTHEAYLYALRQQGQNTKLGIIRGRDGRLTWIDCPLGHDPEPHADEEPPDGLIAVDFAHNMEREP
jgi:S1-C subfamily serine protease